MRVEVVSGRKGYQPQDGDVYVGRPSRWGNPYEIGRDGTRDEVIAKYSSLDLSQHVAALKKLNPKRLVCWCAPLPCHADTLAGLLEE